MDKYNKIYDDLNKFKIKGLGEKTLERLKNMGLETLYDLIYYFPRAYEDRTNFKKIINLKTDEYVVVKGKVITLENRKISFRKNITRARVADSSGFLEVVWFNMPYLKKTLKVGEEYIFIGKIKKGYQVQMVAPEYKRISEANEYKGDILPIYSIIKTISQNIIRRILEDATKKYSELFKENIPQEILDEYNILGRREAIEKIHFPKGQKDLEDAKRRFAIEELLILQMGILEDRYKIDSENKERYTLQDSKDLVKRFIDNMKFNLTKAQKKVITEIYQDLSHGHIVNRLIQGDVGSGKTVVATILLLYMVENSYQGVIMAPTEILATQHFLSLHSELNELGVRVELLTGSIKGKKRREALSRIKEGSVDIVIGTHALIEDSVEFHRLGLIVIDEQHRFGVEQRRELREKGILANLLVMSATPIPRSLALSIYGDLDVSIIDELPPGRKPIKTKVIDNREDEEKVYDFIGKQLEKGRQVYFVAPLIEESEKLNVKSTLELYDEIQKRYSKFSVGLLHGRMKNSEKDEVMERFKSRKDMLIVSTTVIEVGVNVPNATVIVIMNAERFGLSALHQLRGRIGRGEHASYCFLVTGSMNEISRERLRVMEETSDGFKIAEEDLKLRKPGEIFGTRQSGATDLKFVDIIHDVKTIKLVGDISKEYLKRNNGIIKNDILKLDIKKKFYKRVEGGFEGADR